MSVFSFINAWLVSIGVQPVHFFAGLAGGIVRALVNKQGSWIERIIAGAVGTLCAALLTPTALLIFGIVSPELVGAMAFMLGLVGMSLSETVIAMGKSYARDPGKLKEDFAAFLLRLLDSDNKK
mgnify:CR=1 FL=1